mmetsp:Transcript_21606/g.56105  ORF Transcript_21606/g.56105 Transcript_21606/m.56105 type:complete len:209 (-) Transcript_21606:26-652(-)
MSFAVPDGEGLRFRITACIPPIVMCPPTCSFFGSLCSPSTIFDTTTGKCRALTLFISLKVSALSFVLVLDWKAFCLKYSFDFRNILKGGRNLYLYFSSHYQRNNAKIFDLAKPSSFDWLVGWSHLPFFPFSPLSSLFFPLFFSLLLFFLYFFLSSFPLFLSLSWLPLDGQGRAGQRMSKPVKARSKFSRIPHCFDACQYARVFQRCSE